MHGCQTLQLFVHSQHLGRWGPRPSRAVPLSRPSDAAEQTATRSMGPELQELLGVFPFGPAPAPTSRHTRSRWRANTLSSSGMVEGLTLVANVARLRRDPNT